MGTWAEFKGFAADEKTAKKMWDESAADGGAQQDSNEEKRVHPSDKDKKAYTWAEFKGFAKDEKEAKQMWEASKPADGGSAQDDWKSGGSSEPDWKRARTQAPAASSWES